MKKLSLLFIFSLPLLSGYCFGQAKTDSVAAPFRMFTASIYLDYGKLFTIPLDFETKYEGGIELLFLEKFPLIIEAGQATLTPEGAYSNGTYESKGMYLRVGGGYVNQFLPKNKIGISIRYATSTFNENGKIFIESPSGAQDEFVQTLVRKNLKATWYEVVVYSDQKLSDLFSVGVNFRLRILHQYDKQSPIDIYAIPGYGRTLDQTIPAANLFLKVTF